MSINRSMFDRRRCTSDDDVVDLGSLDLRGVKAQVEYIDGEPSMIVSDGDVEIELCSGIGGTWEQAILGAERIATVAQEYAAELRARRPAWRAPDGFA